jgi:hypothetical protein
VSGAIDTSKLGGDITAAAKNLLDDLTVVDQRLTLGLGSAAEQNISAFEPAGAIATHNSNVTAHGTSAFMATVLDDTSAAAAKATLGIVAVASSGSASDLTSGTLSAARLPGLTGDVTAPANSNNTTIAPNVVSNAKLTAVSSGVIKGRASAGPGNVEDLSGTQVTALLDIFSNALKGLVPASGGGTSNFLRADGSWAPPSFSDPPLVDVSIDTTLTLSDHTVWVDAGSGPVNITLPSAASAIRKIYVIKKMDSSDNIVNVLAAETIDGESGFVIDIPYQSASIQSNGFYWGVV